jgi:hypothetical protein
LEIAQASLLLTRPIWLFAKINVYISNRQFKDMAQRGYTSTGWFIGFKLHLVISDKGEIISFKLTRGNVADNNENLLISLCKDLF